MGSPTMALSRRLLLFNAALAPLVACTGTPQWRRVALDSEPLALATAEDGGLLVGLTGPALQGPRGAIGIRASSGYGREGRWVALAARGDRVVGVGMTHGGGHGNARWSIFSGTTGSGLDEQGQPFDVFHGYGSGQLVAPAFVGGEPVLIGSWASTVAGIDLAVWLADGDRWVRHPSAGTALAATASVFPQAGAAIGGERLMIVGGVIELSPLRTRAVAWTSTDPRGDWTRIDLPASATTTIAEAVAAHPGGWLVAGRADAQLAAWTIAPDLSVGTLSVPQVAAGRVRVAASDNGALLIVAGDGSRIQALRGRPGAWEWTSPPGSAPIAAAWGAEPTMISADGRGPLRLFALS